MAQVSDNSEEDSIVNNARVQSDLVIEDHGVPVDTCIDEVPKCSTAFIDLCCIGTAALHLCWVY